MTLNISLGSNLLIPPFLIPWNVPTTTKNYTTN